MHGLIATVQPSPFTIDPWPAATGMVCMTLGGALCLGGFWSGAVGLALGLAVFLVYIVPVERIEIEAKLDHIEIRTLVRDANPQVSHLHYDDIWKVGARGSSVLFISMKGKVLIKLKTSEWPSDVRQLAQILDRAASRTLPPSTDAPRALLEIIGKSGPSGA